MKISLIFIILLKSVSSSSIDDAKEEKLGITLIAPSGSIKLNVLELFRENLENTEFNVKTSDMINKPEESTFGYYASSDKNRTQQVLSALKDKSYIIWAVRGGFGSQAVVKNLQKEGIDKISTKKVIIGFSDVTCLGLYLMTKGFYFLHGPLYYVTETSKVSGVDTGSLTSLKEVTNLFKNQNETISYPVKLMNNADLRQLGTTKILGGNLSVIQRNMFGVLKNIDWNNTLLFLEDTIETPQRSWEVLCGMLESGRFDGIKGIFFGDIPFQGNDDNISIFNEYFTKLNKYFNDRLNKSIPILWGKGFGHGTTNRPIPMGTRTTLTFDQDQNLLINIKWFT